MGCFKSFTVLPALGALLLAAGTGQAATIFTESFSGTTPGAFSNLAGSQFVSTGAGVDVIGELNGHYFECVANAGGNCVDLAASSGPGGMTTAATLALVAGATYTISFDEVLQGYGPTDPATGTYTVALGDFSLLVTSHPVVANRSYSFVAATSMASNLSFTMVTVPDGSHGAVISNVRVEETLAAPGVPEPASWAMMLAGLFGIGGALRHRRAGIAVGYC